jgi:hypothetical protein
MCQARLKQRRKVNESAEQPQRKKARSIGKEPTSPDDKQASSHRNATEKKGTKRKAAT